MRINECFRLGRRRRAGRRRRVARRRWNIANGANAGEPITLFEIKDRGRLSCCSRRTPADVLLLEVGLGGRLDSTNVVETPMASVITPIGIDHIEFLGRHADKIAGEKAGIIKRGVPVICAEQSPEALAVIEQQARRCARRCMPPAKTGTSTWNAAGWSIRTSAACSTSPRRSCSAGISSTMPVSRLRRCARSTIKLAAAAYEPGIVNAEWPARMQRLRPEAGRLAPRGGELWLDGGHNADGGRVAAAALGDLEERVSRPLVVIDGHDG